MCECWEGKKENNEDEDDESEDGEEDGYQKMVNIGH